MIIDRRNIRASLAATSRVQGEHEAPISTEPTAFISWTALVS